MRRPHLKNFARRPVAAAAAAAVLATLAVAVPSRAQAPAVLAEPIDPARLAAEQVAALVRQMSDPAADQDARDLAARRLLTIGRSEARSAVRDALGDPANPGGRLAAARAVAEDLPADPQFIEALFAALDAPQSRPLVDAAVTALANHKMQPDVGRRLVALTAPAQAEHLRVAATRALAGQIEKAAGERLVQLAADPAPKVAEAAIASLQTFASLPLSTAREWADWWRGQSGLPDDRFRLETLTARASRSELQARRGEDTFQELRRSVLAQLAATPREGLADAMAKLLASPRDAVRLIAVRRAWELANTGDLPQQPLRPALRGLLADPSADVRVEAAKTVPLLGEPEVAFDALARQAAVEPEGRVRVELVRAIGATGNVAAVPVLSAMLDDSSIAVVQAAAQALASAGPALRAQSPGRAAELADRLQTVLRARVGNAVAADPATRGLRESLIEALVPLRQQSLRPMYRAMLAGAQPREPESIRRLAAQGYAALAEEQNVFLLAESLVDESPAVRLEVVRALRASSGDFPLIADSLYNRMDPNRESDPRVRAAAWSAIQSLLPVASMQQLQSWSTTQRPLVHDDLTKRLDVLLALAAKATAERDNDVRSSALQSIGDTQRALGEAAEKAGDMPSAAARLAEAAANYREALKISRTPQVVQHLIVSTVEALLRGRDYDGATKFAAEIFAGPNGQQYQGDVLPAFRLEAERLSGPTERQEDALRLIAAAVAMPGVPGSFRENLIEIQKDVQARQRNRNDAWSITPTIGLASAR